MHHGLAEVVRNNCSGRARAIKDALVKGACKLVGAVHQRHGEDEGHGRVGEVGIGAPRIAPTRRNDALAWRPQGATTTRRDLPRKSVACLGRVSTKDGWDVALIEEDKELGVGRRVARRAWVDAPHQEWGFGRVDGEAIECQRVLPVGLDGGASKGREGGVGVPRASWG